MTITNCPRCGSMNITTAGVCANCGWSQFAQVTTVSTRITGEIETILSGKALLNDYKRLLFENSNLKEHIAELKESDKHWAGNVKVCMQLIERYESAIAELEAYIDQLIEVGNGMKSFLTPYVDGFRDSYPATSAWESLVKDWKEG